MFLLKFFLFLKPVILKCLLFFRQIHWFEQQHEKRRLKRDYTPEPPRAARAGYPLWGRTQAQQGQRFRALSAINIFPDPLFKEQWYLVSRLYCTHVSHVKY